MIMIILLFTCCCHLHTGVSVLTASGPMMTCDNNSCCHTLQGQLCNCERVSALIQTHKLKSLLSALWWGFTQDWDVTLTTGNKDCTGGIVVGTTTVKRLRLYRHCSFALEKSDLEWDTHLLYVICVIQDSMLRCLAGVWWTITVARCENLDW